MNLYHPQFARIVLGNEIETHNTMDGNSIKKNSGTSYVNDISELGRTNFCEISTY